ncbi:twin-arginine translocase subunit TatC [Candidatus Poribacteria bacterium]|nr:twin-arginine translocase subunit TatC [Candidatus Poribacteria bacterium]MEE2910763.1 twin-arginine translocase subunit TatC [Candidatus Poribacteria bacterium]|tara:strand:- start:5743 stop:6579 length:837 start_codon:yes stop_codon:yes gene_type:complete
MPADAVNPSAEMTFLEHLEEFRRRVIVSLITVGFFMLISLSFGKPIERILRLPLDLSTNALLASLIEKINGSSASFFGFLAITLRASASSVNATLMKLSPLSGITTYLKVSMTFGALLASPLVLYQVWAFIMPALTSREKKVLLPLFFIILCFFLGGALFAFFIVVPVVFDFSAQLYPSMINNWDIEQYFNFILQLLLGFGIAFELPIVMAFLAWMGAIDTNGFREKRGLATIGIFVLSAFLTPSDPGSMLLMAVPLTLLYELGIFFAYLLERPSGYS